MSAPVFVAILKQRTPGAATLDAQWIGPGSFAGTISQYGSCWIVSGESWTPNGDLVLTLTYTDGARTCTAPPAVLRIRGGG